MTLRRTYEDACAAAHGLDLVGERWALLVVRELILGPKRFTGLRAGLPGISPNVLTQRLEELEEAGVLRRRKLPPPAAAWVYELTPWGRELEPVIVALGRWAARSTKRLQDAPISVDALALSFRTMFDGSLAEDRDATIELRIREERFTARLRDGAMELTRGEAPDAGARLEADPATLAEVVYGGRKFAEAVKAGDLKVEGDKALAKRFVGLFPLPPPVIL